MQLSPARFGFNARSRIRRRIAPVATGAVLVVALMPTTLVAPRANAQATATSTTAAVAPADSLAFIEVPLDEKSEQWKIARDLIDRAGFGPAFDEMRQQALTDAEGNNLPLDALLGGEAGIVVSGAALESAAANSALGGGTGDLSAMLGTPEAVPSGPEPAQGWAVVLDARAPDTALVGITQAVKDQADSNGTAVETGDHAGVAITYAPGDGSSDGSGMAVARVDDHILVGPTPADLEALIDTAQGTTPAIESVAAYTKARQVLSGDDLLFAFINGPASAKAQQALGGIGTASGALAGTDRYSAIQIRADQPGIRMETVAMSADGSPLPNAAAPYASDLLKRTPEDALFFMSAQDLGATGFLDALGAVALGSLTAGFGGEATPPSSQTAEEYIAAQYEAAAALLGFNLQTEFLQQLAGEYGLWVRSQADPSTLGILFASGTKDPGAVVNALSQITLLLQGSASAEGGATTRDVGGSSVTSIPTGPGAPAVEYGVLGKEFVLGVGDAIDRFAAGGGSSLADNAQYQSVMATLPTETNGSLYVDLGQVVPLVRALGESGAALPGSSSGASVPDNSPDCAKYASQEDAQQAYDALEEGTFNLDQNFNGVACEDFFAPAATETPAGESALQAASDVDLSALKAFGLAAFDEDGMRRSSSILYIGEPGS